MTRWSVSLLLLVGCAHVPVETAESAPSPGVHLTSRAVFYAVRGNNLHQLRAEMQRIGPIDDGKHQFAHTWGNYAWKYPYDRSPAGCRTGAVSIELEIVQTFPQRLLRSGGETAREWDRWLSATRAHEDGHRKILLSTAQQLSEQLAALGAQPSCDDADRSANQLGQALLQKMREQHAAYDRDTKHGAATGAHLRDDLP